MILGRPKIAVAATFFCWDAENPLALEHSLILTCVQELLPKTGNYGFRGNLSEILSAAPILQRDATGELRVIRALIQWMTFYDEQIAASRNAPLFTNAFNEWSNGPEHQRLWPPRDCVLVLLRALMRRKHAFEEQDIVALATWFTVSDFVFPYGHPLAAFLSALKNYLQKNAPSPAMTEALMRCTRKISRDVFIPEVKAFVERVGVLIQANAPLSPELPRKFVEAPGPSHVGNASVLLHLKRALGILDEIPEVPTQIISCDQFPLRQDTALASEHRVLGDVVINHYGVELINYRVPAERQIVPIISDVVGHIEASTPEFRGRLLLAIAERVEGQMLFPPPREQEVWQDGELLRWCTILGESDHVLHRDSIFDLLLFFSSLVSYQWFLPTSYIFRLVEDARREAEQSPLTQGERHVLHRTRVSLITTPPFGTSGSETLKILTDLIGDGGTFWVIPGEAWSDSLNEFVARCAPALQRQWTMLLSHAFSAKGSTPSPKWIAKASSLVSTVGKEHFVKCLTGCLARVGDPRTVRYLSSIRGMPPGEAVNLMLNSENLTVLRGMLWMAPLVADEGLARAIGAGAVSMYKKIPGKGPRAVKGGNAAIYALSEMREPAALGQLALLKVKVRFGTAQKEIEKAFTAAAAKAKLPREEIEELAVPTYGLETVGELRETLGEYEAVLTAGGVHDVGLTFFTGAGKALKSVPAAVKKEFKEELKELQASAKDIAQMLPAQAERLDSLYLQERSWGLAVWRERYLDHPLMGVLARRLIWTFASGGEKRAGIWRDGGLVDSGGRALPVLEEGTRVSLWHPIEAGVEEITAWRRLVEESGIVQPFKQAHREIYLLTDAEKNTRTYSNRYGAHIVRQHQFSALCAARGWRHKLRLMVDDTYPPPSRELAGQKLRAEFWVEPVGENYGVDTNESGVFLRLSTDQVRFYASGAAENSIHAVGGAYSAGYGMQPVEALALETIPPLVFSEVMRDVDLFVGVASVGNDPTWNDGGPTGRHRAYWQEYSFGELNATAATRRAVLERLVPRLKFASRASFNERFLVIKGDLRTYQIHLGSGNILMEPHNQYLCIVPSQSGEAADGQGVHLPFEGDRTLAIILSKAFLLANDRGIKDASIVSQIMRSKGAGQGGIGEG